MKLVKSYVGYVVYTLFAFSLGSLSLIVLADKGNPGLTPIISQGGSANETFHIPEGRHVIISASGITSGTQKVAVYDPEGTVIEEMSYDRETKPIGESSQVGGVQFAFKTTKTGDYRIEFAGMTRMVTKVVDVIPQTRIDRQTVDHKNVRLYFCGHGQDGDYNDMMTSVTICEEGAY